MFLPMFSYGGTEQMENLQTAGRINTFTRAAHDRLLLSPCIFTAPVMSLTFLQIATLLQFLSALSSRLLRRNEALLCFPPLLPIFSSV